MRLVQSGSAARKLRIAHWLRAGVGRVPALLVFVAAAVGFAVLSRGAAFGTMPVTGFGEAVTESVAPISAGRIAELSASLGQTVKAGDVLARLDGRRLEAEGDAARARLAKAKAELEAQRGVQDMQVMRGELWALRARAIERGDRAELKVLDQEMRAYEGLSGEHLVSSLQVIEALRRKQSLDARVAMYNGALSRGEAGLDGNALPGGLTHQQTVAVRLAPYEEEVHAAEAELHRIEIAKDELVLRAPADGFVAAILHRAGEVVSAGTEVLSIVAGRRGTIVVSAPEKIAGRLSIGAKVKVRRTGFLSRSFEGVVTELAPLVEEVPLRARPSPQAPAWGRRTVIQSAALESLLPGEAVYVQF